MVRAVVVAALVALAGSASATALTPNDNLCIAAWNTPANAATRHRLFADIPAGRRLLILGGSTATDMWVNGKVTSSSQQRACLIWVRDNTGFLNLVGSWSGTRVERWKPLAMPEGPSHTNARIVPDAKIAKIYRR